MNQFYFIQYQVVRQKRMHQLILICLLFALLCPMFSKEIIYKNNKFYDSQNRQITFHGTNVVVKVPPYIPTTGNYNSLWSFGPQDIKNLKDNGFNAIRLGVMWAGVEPNKNGYNETYLNQMVNIVNAAGKQGIYTLVEFHQDLLSETFCGDGVPIWMIFQLKLFKTFPLPIGKRVTPENFSCNAKSWSEYYFAYDVDQGFAQLYNPKHQLNRRFMKYWQKVAQTFKGNPYVIAYELINQPWVGNFWKNPALLIPSMAERLKLQQFYDQLSAVIRPIDSQTPLCFEPVTFDNFVPSGFSHAPGGNKYRNQSLLCYHYYQPPSLGLRALDTFVRDARKLKIGSMLSQTYGESETLDRADKFQQSWFYWCYKDFGGKNKGMSAQQIKGVKNGQRLLLDEIVSGKGQNLSMQQQLVRTYMQRVAGRLQDSFYNSTTKQFTASYWATAGGKSILFLSKDRVYNNSYLISVYPQHQVQVTQQQGNYVRIRYNGDISGRRIFVSVNKT